MIRELRRRKKSEGFDADVTASSKHWPLLLFLSRCIRLALYTDGMRREGEEEEEEEEEGS